MAAGAMNILRNQEPIREGATVRERQPSSRSGHDKMSVNVKIHESYIKKNQEGSEGAHHGGRVSRQPLTGESPRGRAA